MTIKIGDKLPQFEFTSKTADGIQKVSTDVIFKGRKVVMFAVPGAFTPTCDANHLPGYLENFAAIKAKGVDTIACTAVNDVHVMAAWAKHAGAQDRIIMLADGNAEFAKSIGLDFDLAVANMGLRSKRYSMIVEDGVVTALNVEEKSGVNVSGADTVLEQL
jgi:glutaredoxin/glutathione-dependent peroxiredoxin